MNRPINQKKKKKKLWDVRASRRPLLVSSLSLGGGVWRLRWHPAPPTPAAGAFLLAAVMHAGFAVAAVGGHHRGREAASGGGGGGGGNGDGAPCAAGTIFDASRLRVVARHGAPTHASLGYGADWCPAGEGPGGAGGGRSGGPLLRAAGCSFYDRSLSLWQVEPEPGLI